MPPADTAPQQLAAPTPPAVTPTPPGVPLPPFVDSVFGDLWPERGLAPRPDLVLGSVAVGAVAAVVLPYRNLGLGLLLVLLLSAGLVLSGSIRLRERWTITSAAVGVGLASLVVLRASEWLALVAIAVCGLLLTTALTGARGLPAMAGGVASWVLAAVRGLPLLGRTLTAMSTVSSMWPLVRTVAISLVALVVFGGLFASGDAVFGSWADAIIPDVTVDTVDSVVLRFFVGFAAGGTVLAACYVAINPPRVDRLDLPPGQRVTRAWEWLVPVGFVLAVFVAFVVAQATAMWGGHDYVQRTTGLTYAEYVHQGFGQLTAVTFLTLVTVAIAARKAPRGTGRDQLVLRVVLGTLSGLALVVVASALYRMHVYQEAYGFTVLRVLVDAFELWMGLLLVLVVVAGVRLSARWLPRAALLSGALMVLVLGLANPEAWVAQRNIDRYHASGQLDAVYLRELGPDATPVIREGLPPRLGACITQDWSPEDDDWLAWNLGRARAASDVELALDPSEQASCNALVVSSSTR